MEILQPSFRNIYKTFIERYSKDICMRVLLINDDMLVLFVALDISVYVGVAASP